MRLKCVECNYFIRSRPSLIIIKFLDFVCLLSYSMSKALFFILKKKQIHCYGENLYTFF